MFYLKGVTVTLADIRDQISGLLNYDPANSEYKAKINAWINDATRKILGSHVWSFAARDYTLTVYPDLTFSAISITSGDDFVDLTALTGVDRANVDGHVLYLTSAAGVKSQGYLISFADLASDRVYLTKQIGEATASYTVTITRREITLPSEVRSVEGMLDLSTGTPEPNRALSKLQRDTDRLNPSIVGRSIYWIPSAGIKTQPPRQPTGVATAAAVGQGVRTIKVYQTFTWGGRESPLSQVSSYSLTALQTLTFTPPAISTTVGYYRRYYMTCEEAGIVAPVLINTAGVPTGAVDPLGGVTLTPDLSLTTLQSEDFQATTIRYSQPGLYQRINLYPHPGNITNYQVRAQVIPLPMLDDLDSPLVPPDAVDAIVYEAAATGAFSNDDTAKFKMLSDLAKSEYRRMCQNYLVQDTAPLVIGGRSPIDPSKPSTGPHTYVLKVY